MVFCPYCGKKNEDVAQFCYSCGSTIDHIELPKEKHEKTKSQGIKGKVKTQDMDTLLIVKKMGMNLEYLKKSENKGLYYIIGSGSSKIMIMEDTGIRTDENRFILYKNIANIEDSPNVNVTATVLGGPVGLVAGAVNKKKVTINLIGGDSVVLKSVNQDKAHQFINAVREKVRETCKTPNIIPANTDITNPEKTDSNMISTSLEEIKTAKELLDSGAIIEEEYIKIKNVGVDPFMC